MATKKKRAKKQSAYEAGYEAAILSVTSVPVEQICLRLELAWKRRPDLRLGELITLSQSVALAAQRDLADVDLVEAVERYVGVRT